MEYHFLTSVWPSDRMDTDTTLSLGAIRYGVDKPGRPL